MNLGRLDTHTGIRALPIEGHVKEELISLWTIWVGESGVHGSDGWVPILVGVDPGVLVVGR